MKLIQKAIIKMGDKYLIGLRSPNAKYFPQHWDLPGGKLEPNEDPFLGIKREVKEETDLEVKPLKVLGVYEFDLDGQGENTHRFTIYAVEIISGTVKLSSEHTEQSWATKDEILKLKIEPYFVPFFEEHP
ncbi:MAG: NUDIX hydrolase [Patescibacteria group bacterium]|nr:NUDIX hydrolase [Patescibacteria group bacterium]